MHLHIVSDINPDQFKSSRIASYRLRLSYVFEAAKKIGFNVSGNLNIVGQPNIYYFGKIGIGINKYKIIDIIKQIKISNAKVFVDYTDDWLEYENHPHIDIYKELFLLDSIFVVPVRGLGKKLTKLGKKTIFIPDGIDNFPIIKPEKKNNHKRNILWQGHSSNINSLIRVLGNELVDYDFNLHLVTNKKSFDILRDTKFKVIPKCKIITYYWNLRNLHNVSRKCDFAILPVDKIWASCNRMVSNFRLGLPIIAETISSYEEYSNFYTNFDKINVIDMFTHPEKWHYLVKTAQDKINKRFDHNLMLKLWVDCLI